MLKLRPLLIALIVALMALPARAAEVSVAVAANFTEPAKAIAAAFKRATGDDAVLSFGSSGAFYLQIAHGAPYQVFLSADTERPEQAERAGLGGSRFGYARGRLVLYSREPGMVDPKGEILRRPDRFQKLAIADPGVAPYGEAAMQTLSRLRLVGALKPKLVQGASIGQAFQFVQSGAAELGFVALSQVIGVQGGSRWLVPETLHSPIDQEAILLRPGDASPAARAFLRFLKGPQAKAIIRRYGYQTP
jgi:molybdate transport system substrate-binding protein